VASSRSFHHERSGFILLHSARFRGQLYHRDSRRLSHFRRSFPGSIPSLKLTKAISTRTAGVAVINLQVLHPALLVSYLVMMYISVYPVAMSIRKTNVYEENSLGLYADDHEESFLGNYDTVEAEISDAYTASTRL